MDIRNITIQNLIDNNPYRIEYYRNEDKRPMHCTIYLTYHDFNSENDLGIKNIKRNEEDFITIDELKVKCRLDSNIVESILFSKSNEKMSLLSFPL